MKRLVLVVHGVGDQGPGETLENFASSVTENVAATIDSETVLMREEPNWPKCIGPTCPRAQKGRFQR